MAKDEKGKQITYITLFDGYAIAVDSYSYSAAKQSGKDKATGEVKYRSFSYHGSLDQALLAVKKDYTKKIIMSHDVLTLDDAVSAIVRANNRFEALIKRSFEGVTT